ncbi:hypothetical protein [Rhizobium sp. HT1-10]|uniref:hypothetical protein n=1 Tax=Rhizobium sp. HT1-10 TaxID=3111638 RepID=UPI003C217DC4
MADIIRLEDRRRDNPQPASQQVVAARVLLFTGVRYERLDPPKHRTGPGAKRPRAKSTKRG